MKKLVAVILTLVLALSVAACAAPATEEPATTEGTEAPATTEGTEATTEGTEAPAIKVGFIMLHDENSTYDLNFINAAKEACATLGIPEENYVIKTNVPEGQECYNTAAELADAGCNIIFADSFGHEDYMIQAAKDFPDVQFCHSTGTKAHTEGLSNYHNAFASIYEGRYLAGIAAGMKLNEMIANGEFTADEAKIGYVGAYNYAEVVSGYTAFFLGVQSVYPNVQMEVMYTNSWFDIDKEGAAAEALIANGAVIIGQHADSTGAPAATQKLKDAGKICYSVGYNIDMLETAPTAALTSATNVWEVYYEYLFKSMMDGENPATNWSEGYNEGAVAITDLGPEVAEGTAEKVAEVEAALKDGSLPVFDTSKFTVNGETVTTAPIDLTFYDYSTGTPVAVYQGDTEEAITDGYFSESTLRSAPYFSLRIDGITEDADPVA